MNSRKLIACGLGLTCFLMTAAIQAADMVMLRPKHVTGQNQYVEMDVRIAQDMVGVAVPGAPTKINIHRLYGLVQKVEDVTDDKTQIMLTFDRVSQEIAIGEMKSVYDSDDPDNKERSSPLASVLTPILGMPLKLELDKDNHIKAFSGMMDIRNNLAKMATGNPFLRQIGQEFNDDRARMAYGEARYALYANKEVRVGDRWQRELNDLIPFVGKVVHSYDCKLDRIGDENGRKVAIVTFEGKIRNGERNPIVTQPVNPRMAIEGTFKGTATFDIEKGFFTKTATEGHSTIQPEAAKSKDKDNEEEKAPGVKIELTIKASSKVTPEEDRLKVKEELKKKAEVAKKAADERKAARKKAREERRAKKQAETPKEKGDQKDKDDDDEDEDDE